MRIALSSNFYKDPGGRVLKKVHDFFRERGCELLVDEHHRSWLEHEETYIFSDDFSSADFMITIGGDGSLLRAVHAMRGRLVPIVGINLGSVGFLTEIRPAELEESLLRLWQGQYCMEERMLLQLRCMDGGGQLKFSELALNEAMLSRGASQRIIPVELHFDGCFIEVIRCDGILISSPTGSTGYAMAAGGPIIHPDLQLLQMTPICPYSLHNRTYLLSPETRVCLKLGAYPAQAYLSADGRGSVPFAAGDRVEISRADEVLQMIRLREHNFFEGLPRKLRGRSERDAALEGEE